MLVKSNLHARYTKKARVFGKRIGSISSCQNHTFPGGQAVSRMKSWKVLKSSTSMLHLMVPRRGIHVRSPAQAERACKGSRFASRHRRSDRYNPINNDDRLALSSFYGRTPFLQNDFGSVASIMLQMVLPHNYSGTLRAGHGSRRKCPVPKVLLQQPKRPQQPDQPVLPVDEIRQRHKFACVLLCALLCVCTGANP